MHFFESMLAAFGFAHTSWEADENSTSSPHNASPVKAPSASPARDAVVKRIVELENYLFNLIEEFINSLKARKEEIENQELKPIEIHSILIRRPESWNKVSSKIDKIKANYPDEPDVQEWTTNWEVTINKIREINLFRLINLRQLKIAQSLKHAPTIVEFNEKYEKASKSLSKNLQSAKGRITQQLKSPKYQIEPYQSMLEYLDYNWKALTVFVDSPEIPMEAGGGFVFQIVKPKPGITNYSSYLNRGTPAVILVSSSDKSWKIKVEKSLQVPEAEKNRLDELIQTITELLKQKISSPTPVLSPIRVV